MARPNSTDSVIANTMDGLAAYRIGEPFDRARDHEWQEGWLSGAQGAQRDREQGGELLGQRNKVVELLTTGYALARRSYSKKMGFRDRQRIETFLADVTKLLARIDPSGNLSGKAQRHQNSADGGPLRG